MKKTILLVILLCLCVICASCGNKDNQDSSKVETATQQASNENQQTAPVSKPSIVNAWEYDSSTGTNTGLLGSWAYNGKKHSALLISFYDEGEGYIVLGPRDLNLGEDQSFTYMLNPETKKLTISLEKGGTLEVEYELQENGKILTLCQDDFTLYLHPAP